jgi:hypothetical protein
MSVRRYIGIAIAITAIGGCAQTSSYRQLQSKFSFPNGDYVPLGNVSAEVSRTTFWNAPLMDKASFDELTQAALRQKGGDILVDYVITADVTRVPLLPVAFTTFKIDGTAVRQVVIGRQELR